MTVPQIWPETAGRLRARAILAGLLDDGTRPMAVRLACLAAVGELQDDIPAGFVPAPVEAVAGSPAEAHALLVADLDQQTSIRDSLATSRAAAHLAGLS